MPGLYFLEADDTLNKCEILCTGHLSKALLSCVLCPGLIELSSAFRVLCLSNKKLKLCSGIPEHAHACITGAEFKIPHIKNTSENKLDVLDN